MKKVVILNRKAEGHYSSLKIVNELKKLNVDAIQIVFTDKPDVINGADLYLRWGTSVEYPFDTFNSPEEIKMICNKEEFRNQLIQNKINCPKDYCLLNIDEEDFPLLVRPIHHTQKNEFNIVTNFNELIETAKRLNNYYCQELLEIKTEYRLHVLNNEPIAFYQKSDNDSNLIKICTLPKATTKFGKLIKQLKQLNIQHGAFDLYEDSTGKFGVFDCNTMPTIKTTELAQIYAEKIINIINE